MPTTIPTTLFSHYSGAMRLAVGTEPAPPASHHRNLTPPFKTRLQIVTRQLAVAADLRQQSTTDRFTTMHRNNRTSSIQMA